jgi:hypothetical protein
MYQMLRFGLLALGFCIEIADASGGKPTQGINDSTSGEVCIPGIEKSDPLAPHLGTKGPASPPSTFNIVLDNADSVRIAFDSGSAFFGLDAHKRHRLKIEMDGKPMEEFKFRFQERGSNDLCLFYTRPYGTWRLEPSQWHRKKCTCKDVAH